MSQPSARPSLIVHSTALRFGTGSAPGCARQTGHVRVFGSAKYSTGQRQNIFVRVFRWTWISSPTTGSQFTSRPLGEPEPDSARWGPSPARWARCSLQPLRDIVEGERTLQRVAGAKQQVLG